MSLKDYLVERDKFEAEKIVVSGYDFPCYACFHRYLSDKDEPCRTCDHNAGAVKEPNPVTCADGNDLPEIDICPTCGTALGIVEDSASEPVVKPVTCGECKHFRDIVWGDGQITFGCDISKFGRKADDVYVDCEYAERKG